MNGISPRPQPPTREDIIKYREENGGSIMLVKAALEAKYDIELREWILETLDALVMKVFEEGK